MTNVASIGPHEKPEHRYRKTSEPVERRRIQADVVEAHRGHVRALVRRIVPRSHWDEAQQVGALGVLVALEKYDPTPSPGYTEPRIFWLFARQTVLWELQRWLGAQVFLRPRSQNKKRDEKNDPGGVLREAGRRALSLDEPGLVFAADEPTPEEAYTEAELESRLNAFISTLSKKDKALLLCTHRGEGNNLRSRRYFSLIERLRAFVRGNEGDETGSGVFKRGEAYCDPTAPAATEPGSKAS